VRRRVFGRRHAPDARDQAYPMRALLPKRIPVGTRYYRTGPVLDQGSTPQCVGYGWRQWLSSALLMTKDGPSAPTIYREAQKLDEWPGENYDGTSVRGGVKALQKAGRILSYVWAFDAAAARDWIVAGKGTVVFGTDWLDGMFDPDPHGFLNLTGAVAGGHCYLVCGYSVDRNAFRMLNSWGLSWGEKGRAWLRFDDADRLIKAEGEACTAVEQKIV
jgi:hypothetical protein